MDVNRKANEIYNAVKDDQAAQAKIRAEFKALSVALLTDGNAGAVVTSSTVNGQSFSATGHIQPSQRHSLLSAVVYRLDNQTAISSTQLTSF